MNEASIDNAPHLSEFTQRRVGDKDFFVISGEHSNNEAVNLFDVKVRPSVEAKFGLDKRKWLFLVEGGEIPHRFFYAPPEEVRHVQHIAELDNIPIHDPIISFTPSTIRLTAEELGTSTSNLNELELMITAIIGKQIMSAYHEPIEAIAVRFDKPVEELRKSMKWLNDNLDHREQDIEKFVFLATKRAGDMSNYISAQALEYLLGEHPKRSKVLLQIGRKHLPILDIKPSDIPERARFTKDQIKGLAEERDLLEAEEMRYLGARLINALNVAAIRKSGR